MPYFIRSTYKVPEDQIYSFTILETINTLSNFSRVLKIIVEDIEFHNLLNKYGITVILNPEGHFSFETTSTITPIIYSELMKDLWETFKPLFQEFDCQLFSGQINNLVVID